MRGAVICTICVVLQAGGRHKRLCYGHRIECAMMIVAALGYPATMSLTACASSTKRGSPGFGFSDKFTFRCTPDLHPRRCPALGDLAPVASAGSEGRGHRASERRQRPVWCSLRRRRASSPIRARDFREYRAGRRSRIGRPNRGGSSGKDEARYLPWYKASETGGGQGASPPEKARRSPG